MSVQTFFRSTPASSAAVPAAEARRRLLQSCDKLSLAGMQVAGYLNLSSQPGLVELPPGLVVDYLDLSGCTGLRRLPEDLQVRQLMLNGCSGLEALPAGLRCETLEARYTSLHSLPDGLQVRYRLDLESCTRLERLPQGLAVGTLILRGCTALTALPEELQVSLLDISGCINLQDWPRQASIEVGQLLARGCTRLRSLPTWLTHLAQLDVRDCYELAEFPEGTRISQWLDLANSGLRSLPASLRQVPLRWNGVQIDERIAFHPETIGVREIINEWNLERRRVLLERMGYDRFFERAGAEVVDRDRDAGGERRLLRVRMGNEEDMVCVALSCPSTGRQYIIRVPPAMRSCSQAVAWIAGFDDSRAYRPLAES